MRTNLDSAFAPFGFHHVHTGGGYTAYRREIGRNGYSLVTIDEGGTGSEAPTKLSDPVLVGIYSNKHDDGRYLQFKTLREFFLAMQRGKVSFHTPSPRPNPQTGTRAVATRMTAAEDRFIEFAMDTAGLSRNQAVHALNEMRKGGKKAPLKIDSVTGQFTFSHGVFAEPDVLRRAAELGAARRRR